MKSWPGKGAAVVALLLFAAPGVAETPATIDAMLAALGGREAIGNLRSLSVEADCGGPGGDFYTWVESFLPASTYFAQASSDGRTTIWSTTDRTWHRKADGAMEELDAGMRYFVRSHEFHLLLFQIENRFTKHRAAGAGKVNGMPCRLVEMEDESGQPASICVSNADDLPLYLEMNPHGAAGPVRVTFADWREVEGLRYFFGFTLTEGPERTFTYDYERIEPNGVDALRFVAPAAAGQEADRKALLEVLESNRRAHLETDAARIASGIADALVEVSAGRVNVARRADVEALFTRIFEGARYHMWEDTEPPRMRISSDGTMAWVVRTVRVRRDAPGPDGELQPQAFRSAYTATYAKQGGTWKMTSVTSTFIPR